jgi:hypothetical protein
MGKLNENDTLNAPIEHGVIVTELIQNKADLIAYLTTKKLARKEPPKSVNVTASLRKLIMTDENQGRFVHNGLVKEFQFKSIGGGVYMASIVNNAG